MIAITPSLALDESEIQLEFVRAAGQDGHHASAGQQASRGELFHLRETPNLRSAGW